MLPRNVFGAGSGLEPSVAVPRLGSRTRLFLNSLRHLLQVVYGHLDDPEGQELKRGVSYLKLRPGALILPPPIG
eukprot:361570-Chlamydomonas_euryale.AAC.5